MIELVADAEIDGMASLEVRDGELTMFEVSSEMLRAAECAAPYPRGDGKRVVPAGGRRRGLRRGESSRRAGPGV